MHLFQSRDTFCAELSDIKKWARALQAIDTAPQLLRGVAYSVGDSLTYWYNLTSQLAQTNFLGHRRYLSVISPLDGDVTVKIAPKCALQVIQGYSDLTDREIFDGPAEFVRIPCGGILIIDINEAVKILPSPDTEAVLLHVTVEGYTFANK